MDTNKYPWSGWLEKEGSAFYGLSSVRNKNESKSDHLSGMGHTVLGGGTEDNQYQTHLNFNRGTRGHQDDIF